MRVFVENGKNKQFNFIKILSVNQKVYSLLDFFVDCGKSSSSYCGIQVRLDCDGTVPDFFAVFSLLNGREKNERTWCKYTQAVEYKIK